MDGAFVIKGMAYRVYILQSDRDGSFYIGHAADLTERLRGHNEGRSWYTKAKIPWRVVYQEYLSRRKFNPFSLILLLFDFCNFSS
jgi:predicted GIY-YIG superfamily endonuclease